MVLLVKLLVVQVEVVPIHSILVVINIKFPQMEVKVEKHGNYYYKQEIGLQ